MNVAFGFTKSSLKRWTFFKSWDFFELFENYINDFSKIDQTRFLKNLKLFWRFTMFFFGYIAESNWRGNGKTLTFFWEKKTQENPIFFSSIIRVFSIFFTTFHEFNPTKNLQLFEFFSIFLTTFFWKIIKRNSKKPKIGSQIVSYFRTR